MGKLKISKIKRNNQKKTKLTKQSKVAVRHRRSSKNKKEKPLQNAKPENSDRESNEDPLDMIEEEDLNFLRRAVANKSYNLLRQIQCDEGDRQMISNKYNKRKHERPVEELYEECVSRLPMTESDKKVRMLLPIKLQSGIVKKRIVEENNKEDNEGREQQEYPEEHLSARDENSIEMELQRVLLSDDQKKDGQPVSTIDLLGCREENLRSMRFKIGVLSSGLLENPEQKSQNFKVLLDLMEKRNSEIRITVRKLATVSLLEIFKDLLPSYSILAIKQEGVKLKKETLQLQNYEGMLLRSYKVYLQKLEKMSNILRKKKGDTRILREEEIGIGELGIKCMCELLITHPYFNFSVNIANFLVPFLDNKRATVRETVARCISQVFKEDKRGEISCVIVRRLNKHVKLRDHAVHPEFLSVLLSLRIKDVNLEREEAEEAKQRRLMSHKQRILALSKRERKKNKQLEQVEKELLETKAEENKRTRQKILTEITSIVFTIYFRILKQMPSRKVLSVCIEGLAKFAHCINLDFSQDLLTALNNLIEANDLGVKERLQSIWCAFTILSGEGAPLNVDPYRFYAHLYRNLLKIQIGKTETQTELLIKVLVEILMKRRKRITQARLIAFVKRISTLALQLQQNGALGLLSVIKGCMQAGKTVNVLLDTDGDTGSGIYQAEVEDPEYCNAQSTALWEITALQRHYHSTVQKVAKNIAYYVPINGESSLSPAIAKLTPEEFYAEFDPCHVTFKPPIPVPKKDNLKRSLKYSLASYEFEKDLGNVDTSIGIIDKYIDFYKEMERKN